jgi:malonate transporter and related proteins
MTTALSLLVPVFAIILLGYYVVATNRFDSAAIKTLNDFALWIALPALLFRSAAETAAVESLGIASIYITGCLIVYVLAAAVARFWMELRIAETAVFALNSTYGNIIYMATPVIAAMFGQPGVALILPIIALHSGFLLPLTSALMEFENGGSAGARGAMSQAGRNILRNPILVSIALGTMWHQFEVPMPEAMRTFLSMIGGAALPLALFCVGASLPGFLGEGMAVKAVAPVIFKMLLLPLVIGGLALAAGFSGLVLSVAVIAAAMPTGASAFLLARQTIGFGTASASIVAMTTASSVVTLSVLLLYFT